MALLPGSSLGGDLDSSLWLTTSYPVKPESSYRLPSQSHRAPLGAAALAQPILQILESSYISSPASTSLPPASTSCPKCCEGLPLLLGCSDGKGPACTCRRCRFDPWVGKIPWRRKWQPTPVFLPGESHGQRSMMGYSPWGHKEAEMKSKYTSSQVF